MAEKIESRPTIYYIPENFLGESRILNGQIRVRYLIDSIGLSAILALIFGLPLLLFVFREATFNVKITVLVISVAPGFLAGQFGYNGDPVSVFLTNVYRWRKKRQIRLYNEKPRLFGTDPVKALYESNRNMDKLVGLVQNVQEKRIERKNAEVLVEGETFEFQYDPSIDRYLDNSGDYEETGTDERWPAACVSIASGNNLEGLESFLGIFDESSQENYHCKTEWEGK